MPARRFEFEEGTSSKFWSIARDGRSMTVTFGRIGSAGQEKKKSFPDQRKAAREEEKLIAEKLAKGYKEATGGQADDADDGEPKPPPRGFSKPASWEAVADAWAGARATSKRRPWRSSDAKAVAKALGIDRLPPSYLAYVERFLALGELELRYEREHFQNYLDIHHPKDLVKCRDAYRNTLQTYAGMDDWWRKAVEPVGHLIPFGYDTSRTDICWDPSRATPDGEMAICFYTHDQPRRLDLGRRLEDVVKYFRPGSLNK